MKISDLLKSQIEADIATCESYTERNGSERLYSELVARYIVLDPSFKEGLSSIGKAAPLGSEYDYRPELRAIASKLKMFLILSEFEAEVDTMSISAEDKSVLHAEITMSNKVFIVHGHDNAAKLDVARVLEKGGFDPVILHEQPDAGKTIIEKIEQYTDVRFAVVLYTACDVGREKNAPNSQEKNRARQNVVFEHGYLIAKLGRQRVCAMVKGEVETPGDISGVIYTKMDEDGAWRIQLAKNMEAAGLSVDMNKLCK